MIVSVPPFTPSRAAGEIVLYLSALQPSPSIPFEIQEHVSPEVWGYRVPMMTKEASRFSRPVFERVWATIAVISMIVVPLALHNLIFTALTRGAEPTFNQLMEARGIGFGIFIGLLLLFLLPMATWKYIGQRRANNLLKQWAQKDRMNASPTTQQVGSLTWKVKTPGLFRDIITLTITLPPNKGPTNFHPDAYLPSYINRPQDADAAYFYPYKPGPGLPQMSVVGDVPLYLDEKEEFSGSEKV